MPHHQSLHSTPCCPQCQPNPNLPRSATYGIADYSIQAHRRQQQSRKSEDAEDNGRYPRQNQRLVHMLLDRLLVKDGQSRIYRMDLVSQRRRQLRRVTRIMHQQRKSESDILRV